MENYLSQIELNWKLESRKLLLPLQIEIEKSQIDHCYHLEHLLGNQGYFDWERLQDRSLEDRICWHWKMGLVKMEKALVDLGQHFQFVSHFWHWFGEVDWVLLETQ